MGEWRRWGAQALHRRGPKERDSGYGELVENYWRVTTGRDLGSRAAWSGAFISYVMKEAGAGTSWPATGSNAHYIQVAMKNREQRTCPSPIPYPARPDGRPWSFGGRLETPETALRDRGVSVVWLSEVPGGTRSRGPRRAARRTENGSELVAGDWPRLITPRVGRSGDAGRPLRESG